MKHTPWLALLLGVLVTGCGQQSASPAPTSQAPQNLQPVETVAAGEQPSVEALSTAQVLRRSNGEEPETLDPHRAQGVPAHNVLRDLFEGLTMEKPDGTITPGAAAHWDISRDGKRYTFYLRENARWSNGDPVTAEDYVEGLRRSADPATGSPAVQVLSPIVNGPQVFAGELPPDQLAVRALNALTVQIDLVAPTPYFLSLLTLPPAYPVHRPTLEQYGDAYSRPGNLVGNGAFELQEWAIYSHIKLTPNQFYWDRDSVRLDAVYYYPIADQSAELARYRAGDLDWTYEVPSSQFNWLEKNLSEQLIISPWLGTYYLGFNLTQPPFEGRPGLRTALSLAVDRELLVEKVTRFGELPSFTLVPPGIPGYEPPPIDYAEWTQSEREAEARRLYRDAGYSADQPLQVELRYNTSANHKKIALALAAMWSQVLGVETILINEEWKVFLQNRLQRRVTEVFRGGWIGDYNDPYAFLEIYHSGHRQNDSGYDNASYDRLLERIATERIPSRRMRLLAEAERILLEDQPFLPLYTYVTKRLISPRVQGWQPNIMDHHLSRWMFIVRSTTEAAAEDATATEPEQSPDAAEQQPPAEQSTEPPPAEAASDEEQQP
ncbi:MAG: ABC transporter substrate-binding protein [Wenzhouxiangellaceae bacterium]